jgi:prophage antirepressor-like protein
MMAKTLMQVEVQGVRGYVDGNQAAYLWLEDAARGLGIVKVDKKDGVEYTRINAQQIKKMLIDFGNIVSENGGFSESSFPKTQLDELPQYISESAFYYMAMKANNETARKFQYLVTTKILPQIRKTGSYIAKITPQTRLKYLDRVQKAARTHDAAMLEALYAQCDEIGITVPKYEISEGSGCGTKVLPYVRKCYTLGLPAVEYNGDGTVTVRQNEIVELDGVKKTLKEWCRLAGLSRTAFRRRISRGWSLEDALTKASSAH